MFKKAGAAALLSAALLFAGCSGGGGVSKTASLTCTMDESGMNMKVTMTAPSEDKPIDSMKMEVTMNYEDMGVDTAGVDTKQLMEALGEPMKAQLAEQVGVAEEQVELESDDKGMTIKINIDDPKEFFENIVNTKASEDDLIFKNAAKELKANMDCE